ncbi:MAG TPA: hypothetical protein VLZ77_00695 [Acidimicrobiales bacterium]|nr:hypothetical protein [Acidimicrobiales bacterium]
MIDHERSPDGHGADGHGPAVVTPHHRRLWRWLAFDPPMRDRRWRGRRHRTVTCRSCACDLGTTDDPFDGIFMAWRHRRVIRRGS